MTTASLDRETPVRARGLPLRTGALCYVALIAVAEVFIEFGSIGVGASLDAVVVFVALNHYIVSRARVEAAAEPDRMALKDLDLLLVLSLVPIARLCSLTMAVPEVPTVAREAVIGAPVVAAVVWTAVLVGPMQLLNQFHVRSWSVQGRIALAGLPLGFVAYLLLRPDPVTSAAGPSILLDALILTVFVALLEEVVYRGLLQSAFSSVFGSGGRLASAFLFGVAYLGFGSISYVVFITVVGYAFGVAVSRTQSLVGVILAHALLSIGLVLMWPLLIG